jgi:hypothetical protein
MSEVTEFLTLSCSIRRKTIGKSSSTGTNSYTWADAATSVPCSIQVDSRFQAQRAMRENTAVDYRVYFEPGISTPPLVGDRLTSISEYSGQHFEVVSIGSTDVGNSEYTKIIAHLRRGGGTQ